MSEPMPPQSSVKGWRVWLRRLWMLLVVAAFVGAVVARREDLGNELRRLEPLTLVLSAVVGIAGVGVSGLVWRRMLRGVGSELALAPAIRVFFVAQLGKYLPGSLWPVLAQAELGRDHGVPRRSAVAAQTLFMWVHLVTGALLGLPAFAAAERIPWWTCVAMVPLAVMLVPGPLGRVMDGLLVRFRRQPLPMHPSLADMVTSCGWALLMWVLYGLHIHLLAGATFPDLATVVGLFAGAWSVGFLFLVAPAGAGAREVVLVAGLAALVGNDAALAAALLSRLLLTIADGAWGALGLVLRRPRGPG